MEKQSKWNNDYSARAIPTPNLIAIIIIIARLDPVDRYF